MSDIAYPDIEEALEKNGEIMTSTSGVSMYPMLRNRRDMVVITSINGELRENDVPLYRLKSGKLILHRILEVKDDYYIIRGDNLLVKEKVPKSNVVGVLKCFYRGGKYCDCETSRKYKLYVFIIRISFPVRFLWKKYIRPFLSKIKHLLIK